MENPDYVKLAIKIVDKIFKVIKKEVLKSDPPDCVNTSDKEEKKNHGKITGWVIYSCNRNNNCGINRK